MYQVDNAIIMAAGMSSRFAPLSYEIPKALTEVKGEILIERQISQLHEAGIHEIYIVVGYKADQFDYLQKKLGVHLIKNDSYQTRNNHSSIYAAKNVIRNTFICSADNYFHTNPFESSVEESYYAAVFSPFETKEWCIQTDINDYITRVQIGGANSWYMLGHAFWSEDFSEKFLRFLDAEYHLPQTRELFWENILINHLDELRIKIRKYPENYIYEFDSIDELRHFDETYVSNTRSAILKSISMKLNGTESEITAIEPLKNTSAEVIGICFYFRQQQYHYTYCDQTLRRI